MSFSSALTSSTASSTNSSSSFAGNTTTTAASSSGNAAPAFAPGAQVDPAALVYHIDLILIGALGLYILAVAPRAFARLSRASEWAQGFILRRVDRVLRTYKTPISSSSIEVARSQWIDTNEATSGSDDSHTYDSHTHLNRYGSPSRYGATPEYTPHVASCFALFRPIIIALRHRLSPGFSIGQLIVLAVYFSLLLYASFYKSNTFADSTRDGFVAMSQIPFVFAFAAKNNILGMFMGMGYEKVRLSIHLRFRTSIELSILLQLNFLHRMVGRFTALAANVHALGFSTCISKQTVDCKASFPSSPVYKWSLAGTFTATISKPVYTWGLVALICMDFLFFFSTSFFRNNAYNLFLATHIISFSILLPALWYHTPTVIPYVITALSIYGLDRIASTLR